MGNLSTSAKIDSVSEDDVVIGAVNRRDLPELHANFRVVHIFILNHAGELLLQHIAKEERNEGRWGSSVAGYVHSGETYRAAALRKLRAELGVQTPLTGIGKTSMPDLGAKKFIRLFEGHCEGPFTPDRKQVAGLRFRPLEDVRKALEERPDDFTETFREVFSYFERTRSS